ncbi:ABC transporter ATP-binding protein [Bifidobacterium sp. LC6]|uniref:ABC transporter ATP-binding protein n=1 Tax=Bifidobacterium colobi TaxID=2809026 RepID=A0ABS5UUV4_9BIFI|nr:ABC transporter ATP-binding protein [Bifidobacterium colobi]MBT1174879.1 ABC transporter ATP-binding protein [Bifidobacterium colobi]
MTTATDQSPMALSITGATKHYDSGFTLDDITFDLPAGYIMGLIGPNGAGKSTLIKLILNMIHRDSGEIHVLGLDNIADEETVKENLGVVFDSSYFIETWTVNKVEQAMAPMYLAWDHATFDGYLTRFGLDRKKRVKELSRGMQMKLMLAVALSHDAKLLVLDEPTSGLDVLARDELMDILQNYIADGERSVLFSTHITADLERAADFITYITRGTLYFTGPKDEFEESFRLVKGGPEDLAPDVKGVAVGIHRYETGFDALVRAEDLGKIAGLKAEDGRHWMAPLTAEPVSIDDIIRLTNTGDAAHAMEVA